MNDLMKHIQKAKEYALRDGIKANTIIIDEDIAKVNGFQIMLFPNTITNVPNMILGLDVYYEKDLREKIGTPTNFVVAEMKKVELKTPLSEYSTDELLEEIKRRIEAEV